MIKHMLCPSVCTDEIAGQARNDAARHPGPDSLVCTDEIAGQARNDESKARNDASGHPGLDPGPGSSVCASDTLRNTYRKGMPLEYDTRVFS